jgi:hypothetical protein
MIKEFCKRGHLMAETRVRDYHGTCCGVCKLDNKRRAQRRAYARKIGRPVRTAWGHFRKDPKNYHLRWLLEKRYGITLEQYNEMVELQGGRCAICNKVPAGTNHTSRRLAVDHDHVTGTVRGLLCGPCNTTIGMIEDSPGMLDRMRRYLGKHAQLRLVEK